jgi:hypothetical protein
MTHTAEPMTLAQVREDIKDVYYSAPDQLTEAIVPLRKLNEWMHAIDAEIAKQHEAVPVAFVPVHPKNGPLWANTTAIPNSENVPQHYPLMPLYDHPQQRNAAEVTQDIVDMTVDTYKRHLVNTAMPVSMYAMKCAIETALSAVASRDREDAELFGIHMIAAPSKEAAERVVSNFNQYWDNHKSERGHDVHVVSKLTTWEFGAIEHAKDVVKNFGEYVDLLEPFDAARRENKP